MRKIIHVNQHVIKRNAKTGEREPVVTCKTYNSNHYGHEVELHDGGSVVYKPDKPLACGAKVWIVTKGAVTIYEDREKNETGRAQVACAGV